jgi:hypothetical protein
VVATTFRLSSVREWPVRDWVARVAKPLPAIGLLVACNLPGLRWVSDASIADGPDTPKIL